MKTVKNENKWLLVSCLQKSIRRGYTDLAVSYAKQLYDIDKVYLIYRLSVIALEDVGLANIDLVHEIMSTQLRKETIEKAGGKNYILNITKKLSNSVKDRSACDLTSLVSYYKEEESNPDINWSEVFMHDNEPIINRVLAGWEILGAQKLKNPLVVNKHDDIEKFIELNSKIVKNKKIIDILKFGYHIHREPHFIALGLLEYLYQKEKGFKLSKHTTGDIISETSPIVIVDKKWVSEGVDWHTKEGKKAVHDFCQEKTDTLNYLKELNVPEENIAPAIAQLLFRTNGHQVNYRLFYPSAVVIMKLSQKQEFIHITQNPQADIITAMKLFKSDYGLMQQKIEKVFKVADPNLFPF